LQLERFVDQVIRPTAFSPVEKTHLQIRIPAAMTDLAAQIDRKTRAPIAVGNRFAPNELTDLSRKCFANFLVRIEAEDEVVCGCINSELFLPAEAEPFLFDDARAEFRRDLPSRVCAA